MPSARQRPRRCKRKPRSSPTPTSARQRQPRGFKTAFEANGGRVIDAIPAGGPGQVPDFTPFFQRAKDEKPDVLFVFVPAGDHATAAAKTYGALGMRELPASS